MEQTLELFIISNLFSLAIDFISATSMGSSSHRLNPLVDINSTSTFISERDLSRLIPNIKYFKPTRFLRLIEHGSSRGEVHLTFISNISTRGLRKNDSMRSFLKVNFFFLNLIKIVIILP